MTSQRLLALIDVDGVLNPYGAPSCPPGYTEHELFEGEQVRVNPAHGALLRRLVPHFDLVWATSWEQDANRLLAPLLGLPALPLVEFPPHPGGHYDKFPEIARAVGDRPAAWLDDLHSEAAFTWAAGRREPTRLVPVDPCTGLLEEHIDEMLRFALETGAAAGDRTGSAAPSPE
ncbi:HAD domain-containing protein [Streptomyces sulphureus]|uniref:HAD domain-containing protein n=1 Tax=Streptomyces sulphureus TaxID=47758 RepID=UPI00035CB02A|nr:HAD domain-containing protein [Streptomyces sulphureus]